MKRVMLAAVAGVFGVGVLAAEPTTSVGGFEEIDAAAAARADTIAMAWPAGASYGRDRKDRGAPDEDYPGGSIAAYDGMGY